MTSSWETLDVGAGTPQRLSTAKPAFWFLAFISISRSKVYSHQPEEVYLTELVFWNGHIKDFPHLGSLLFYFYSFLSLIILLIIYLIMCEYFVCMCVCAPRACSDAQGSQKRTLSSLGLELRLCRCWIWKETWVLCKCNKDS